MLSNEFWEKYFLVYDSLNELIPYRKLIDTIVGELSLFRNAKVLDAGAGTGNLALRIKSAGATPVGLDVSSFGLQIYKTKIPNGDIYLSDLVKPLPFPDCYFDRVVSNNTLYTIDIDKRQRVVCEFYRVLKPGGIIVISNLNNNFSPIRIFLSHISESISNYGLLSTSLSLIRLFSSVIKIFYYNAIIKRYTKATNANLFFLGDQERLLSNAGFHVDVSSSSVYSGSAYLVRAHK